MTLPDDDVLAPDHEAMLDIATTAITSPEDHLDLLARAADWLASSREHAAFYRHLLRDADQLTLDAHLARWTW